MEDEHRSRALTRMTATVEKATIKVLQRIEMGGEKLRWLRVSEQQNKELELELDDEMERRRDRVVVEERVQIRPARC